jgi:putative hydrolase of the HAD superfamily
MYKAIVFDFFGVFCPDITLNWFQKTVPNYREKLSEFQSICTRSDYGTLSKADFYKEVSILANVSVGEMMEDVEAETIINTALVKYVKDLKHRGYQTACLSNGTREWTLAVISNHGLGNLFDEVVLSGDLGIVKPNSKIYVHTLEKLNIMASEAIFVDDRKVNVDAAEACGIRSLVFSDLDTFINELEHLAAVAK